MVDLNLFNWAHFRSLVELRRGLGGLREPGGAHPVRAEPTDACWVSVGSGAGEEEGESRESSALGGRASALTLRSIGAGKTAPSPAPSRL